MSSVNFTATQPPEDRIGKVQWIFSHITPHYDLLNHILSAGNDFFWRRFTVKRLPKRCNRVLDVATGTGDLAFDIVRMRKKTTVVGVDFVPHMLEVAIRKGKRKGLLDRASFMTGDALALPLQDNQFDAATIAFGLRNIVERERALREMARVVRPGGKVMVLEMTFPRNIGARWFYTWYLNRVIPLIGALISGNSSAYRYLPDSIQEFPAPMELVDLFHKAGLRRVKAFPLSLGITWLHEGVVQR